MVADSKKILLVEDDKFLADVLKGYFENKSYEVEVANESKSGLSKAESFSPDLILLDILMPGTSGMSVLGQLRGSEKHKTTPIVMLTNVEDQILSDKALEMGVSKYFIKANTSLDTLENCVSQLLGVNA